MQVDHADLVRILHAQQPPEHTIAGAISFTVRLIRALPANEGAGLLFKDAGENIGPYGAFSVSAGRVCYPDGQLYKVLSDIPTTMAPVWNDDGTVDPSRLVPVSAVTPPAPPEPLPPPLEPGPGDDLDDLIGALDRIYTGLADTAAAVDRNTAEIAKARNEGVRIRLR